MTDVERYTGGSTELSEHDWANLERRARALASTSLVPRPLQGKPNDILAIALAAHALGMELTITTLPQFHVIEGRVEPSAQLMVTLAARAGHEVWLDGDNDSTKATAYGRRRGSDRVHSRTFTIQDAERAGLTRKDNWKHYPADMLVARAVKRVCKLVCPDVLLGLPGVVDDEPSPAPPPGVDAETGEIIAQDYVDAELVGDDDAPPRDEAPPPTADDEAAEAAARGAAPPSAPASPATPSLPADPPPAGPEPELFPDGPGGVGADWARRFTEACERIRPPEIETKDFHRLIIERATKGRVGYPRGVTVGEEQAAVYRVFTGLRDGHLEAHQVGDEWEITEVPPEDDRAPF